MTVLGFLYLGFFQAVFLHIALALPDFLDQAGLKLTEVYLPLPPQCCHYMCFTTPS